MFEGIGAELQDGVGGRLVPEFFRPFDAATQLLGRRFHQAARNGQAEPSVLRIVHPRPVMGGSAS